jgi:hypothetical protein
MKSIVSAMRQADINFTGAETQGASLPLQTKRRVPPPFVVK